MLPVAAAKMFSLLIGGGLMIWALMDDKPRAEKPDAKPRENIGPPEPPKPPKPEPKPEPEAKPEPKPEPKDGA